VRQRDIHAAGLMRRKLESDPARPRIFRTDVGVGYRLLVDDT